MPLVIFCLATLANAASWISTAAAGLLVRYFLEFQALFGTKERGREIGGVEFFFF